MDTDFQTPTPDPAAASDVAVQVESLSKIVADSAAANDRPRSRAGKKKSRRAGGRPRKDGSPNKATLKLMGLDSDPLSSPTPSGGTDAEPLETLPPPAGVPDSGLPALELPTAMLKPLLRLPFTLCRARTGFEGFNLPDDACDECLPLLEHVLKQYLPETNSPHAPAVTLALTLGMFLASQAAEYRAWNVSKNVQVVREPAPRAAGFPSEVVQGGTL